MTGSDEIGVLMGIGLLGVAIAYVVYAYLHPNRYRWAQVSQPQTPVEHLGTARRTASPDVFVAPSTNTTIADKAGGMQPHSNGRFVV